jgi:hypothetical protein
MDKHGVEVFAITMWRYSEQLLKAPMPYLAQNIDTFVDAYHNLEDIIRLANMGKHEEVQE